MNPAADIFFALFFYSRLGSECGRLGSIMSAILGPGEVRPIKGDAGHLFGWPFCPFPNVNKCHSIIPTPPWTPPTSSCLAHLSPKLPCLLNVSQLTVCPPGAAIVLVPPGSILSLDISPCPPSLVGNLTDHAVS